MRNLVTIIQIVVSVALIGLILIQAKGTGLGRSSGSGASFSRRGLEKLIFRLTFFLAALFLIGAIILLWV